MDTSKSIQVGKAYENATVNNIISQSVFYIQPQSAATGRFIHILMRSGPVLTNPYILTPVMASFHQMHAFSAAEPVKQLESLGGL